jgi:hypothetical protein
VGQCGPFQFFVVAFFQPARGGDDLQRVGQRHQNLRQQLVRVERARRQHRIELLDIELRCRLLADWCRPRLGKGWRRQRYCNRRDENYGAD